MHLKQQVDGAAIVQEFRQFLNINGRINSPTIFRVYIKYTNMIFTNYTKTDSYYEFVGENGEKQIYPVNSIILTDDESGFIAVKNTASRQTVGLIRK